MFIIFPAIFSEQTSENELKEISSRIWQSDTKRLSEHDVVYDKEGPRLFINVNEKKLTGTYRLLIDLFDNYNPKTGQAESCSESQEKELDAFIDGVSETPPIQILHSWLFSKGLARKDLASFKKDLRSYWFTGYSRSGSSNVVDSSGFEHVFLGEVNEKKKKVIGFHSWLFAYEQEKSSHFVYKNLTGTCPNNGISFNFKWLGFNKPISSIMIRSSPQVELSLFTLCLLAMPGTSCEVLLGGNDHTIITHVIKDEFIDLRVATAYFKC